MGLQGKHSSEALLPQRGTSRAWSLGSESVGTGASENRGVSGFSGTALVATPTANKQQNLETLNSVACIPKGVERGPKPLILYSELVRKPKPESNPTPQTPCLGAGLCQGFCLRHRWFRDLGFRG